MTKDIKTTISGINDVKEVNHLLGASHTHDVFFSGFIVIQSVMLTRT